MIDKATVIQGLRQIADRLEADTTRLVSADCTEEMPVLMGSLPGDPWATARRSGEWSVTLRVVAYDATKDQTWGGDGWLTFEDRASMLPQFSDAGPYRNRYEDERATTEGTTDAEH